MSEERRKGGDRRTRQDRRSGEERRKGPVPAPEKDRRSGQERRNGSERRDSDRRGG